MSKHNETGIKGENIAKNFLETKGYEIVHCNWRFGKKEIDIIAMHKNTVVFIEVKTRSSFDFGFPEEAVSVQKQNYMKAAAETYLDEHPEIKNLQFDIISILLNREEVKEIRHFEDAFY
jgi:putative endonuclease